MWGLAFYPYVERDDILVHKTSLTISLFIEVTVRSQKSEQSCICMLEYHLWLLLQLWYLTLELFWRCGIVMFDVRIVLTVWYCDVWRYNCSDGVVLWCLPLELFWQCGNVMFDVIIVLTVWYCDIWRYNCSDSVVLRCLTLELFWGCGIVMFDVRIVLTCGIVMVDVRIVLTVWYCYVWRYYCSDGVVLWCLTL